MPNTTRCAVVLAKCVNCQYNRRNRQKVMAKNFREMKRNEDWYYGRKDNGQDCSFGEK